MVRRGSETAHETLTPEETKKRWPHYAAEIDAAVAKVATEREQTPK
jgi:hypothetical protein